MIRKQPAILCAAALVLAMMAVAGIAMAALSTVGIRTKEGIGSYLADGKGFTLYTFKKDLPDKSACTSACTERWPLFYAQKVTVLSGLKAEDFETIKRRDGKKQTAYKGMPLYYFIGDSEPDQTSGQGFEEQWYVAKP